MSASGSPLSRRRIAPSKWGKSTLPSPVYAKYATCSVQVGPGRLGGILFGVPLGRYE